MEHFSKIVNSFQPLSYFTKSSIIDILKGPEYASQYPQLKAYLQANRWYNEKINLCLYLS